jgi:spoIIIJ-associated protein
MSSSIEVEGGTVEEAVDGALASLGAQRADVEIEVLANPSRGLFGLGGRKARVRVTLRPAAARPLEASPPPAARPPDGSPPAALDATLLRHGREVLEDLVRRMGFESTVTIEGEGEDVVLQISGDNTSVLIGKHGQTLDALEYVLNRIVSREEESASRLHVDCEQYRVKRQRSLEQLAQRMGDEAKRKGRSVTLNPMSPRDRRIVHLALQADAEVTTRSSGEGFYRTLVIIPEGGERRRGRPRGR